MSKNLKNVTLGMSQNVSKCQKLYQNVLKCLKMSQIISKNPPIFCDVSNVSECLEISQKFLKYFVMSQNLTQMSENISKELKITRKGAKMSKKLI